MLSVQSVREICSRHSQSGLEVMYNEISKYRCNDKQIDLIADDYPPDVRQLVWVMLCKQYHFIGDTHLMLFRPFERT